MEMAIRTGIGIGMGMGIGMGIGIGMGMKMGMGMGMKMGIGTGTGMGMGMGMGMGIRMGLGLGMGMGMGTGMGVGLGTGMGTGMGMLVLLSRRPHRSIPENERRLQKERRGATRRVIGVEARRCLTTTRLVWFRRRETYGLSAPSRAAPSHHDDVPQLQSIAMARHAR